MRALWKDAISFGSQCRCIRRSARRSSSFECCDPQRRGWFDVEATQTVGIIYFVSLEDVDPYFFTNHITWKSAKAETRPMSCPDTCWSRQSPRPARSRNEDVCSERLKNLCSERLDEDGSLIRKSIVDNWPHNALRHSFGSYHYAQYRDENRTAAEMGNSPAVVFRHYRALVKREAADAFWMLRPV